MAREFENDREAARDITQKHYDEIDDYDRLWRFISHSRCCRSGGRWGEFRHEIMDDGIEIGGPGAVLPPSGDDVDLRNVTSPKGLELPDRVAGSLYLDSLQTAEGLELPEHVGGSLILDSLEVAVGLNLPRHVGGLISLKSLEVITVRLKLPKSGHWDIYLPSLQSAENLKFPKRWGSLFVWGSVEGHLWLPNLETARGLKLPKYMGGTLSLPSLRSAEGVTFPAHVTRGICLNSLQTPNGLKLPDSVGGNIELWSMRARGYDRVIHGPKRFGNRGGSPSSISWSPPFTSVGVEWGAEIKWKDKESWWLDWQGRRFRALGHAITRRWKDDKRPWDSEVRALDKRLREEEKRESEED